MEWHGHQSDPVTKTYPAVLMQDVDCPPPSPEVPHTLHFRIVDKVLPDAASHARQAQQTEARRAPQAIDFLYNLGLAGAAGLPLDVLDPLYALVICCGTRSDAF